LQGLLVHVVCRLFHAYFNKKRGSATKHYDPI
jgi:hypothetical protein